MIRQHGCEHSRLLIWLHAAIVSCCIVTLAAFYLAWWSVPEGIVAFLSLVAGTSIKALADATNFEFGSSRSSRAKDALIATLKGGGA